MSFHDIVPSNHLLHPSLEPPHLCTLYLDPFQFFSFYANKDHYQWTDYRENTKNDANADLNWFTMSNIATASLFLFSSMLFERIHFQKQWIHDLNDSKTTSSSSSSSNTLKSITNCLLKEDQIYKNFRLSEHQYIELTVQFKYCKKHLYLIKLLYITLNVIHNHNYLVFTDSMQVFNPKPLKPLSTLPYVLSINTNLLVYAFKKMIERLYQSKQRIQLNIMKAYVEERAECESKEEEIKEEKEKTSNVI